MYKTDIFIETAIAVITDHDIIMSHTKKHNHQLVALVNLSIRVSFLFSHAQQEQLWVSLQKDHGTVVSKLASGRVFWDFGSQWNVRFWFLWTEWMKLMQNPTKGLLQDALHLHLLFWQLINSLQLYKQKDKKLNLHSWQHRFYFLFINNSQINSITKTTRGQH